MHQGSSLPNMNSPSQLTFLQYSESQKCLIWSSEDNDWKTHSIAIYPSSDTLLCHFRVTGVYSYAKLGEQYDETIFMLLTADHSCQFDN